MSSLIAVLSTNVVASLVKKLIQKYGPTTVRIMVFVVAVIITCVIDLMGIFPGFKIAVLQACGIFTSAIALYHVLWKPMNDSLSGVDLAASK